MYFMNGKLFGLGIVLVILTGALVLFKGQIYSSLGVPSPSEIQAALQSDNPTLQEEAATMSRVAQFIDKLPLILLGIAIIFLVIGIMVKGKKIEKLKKK